MVNNVKFEGEKLTLFSDGKEVTVKMPTPITQALLKNNKVFIRLKLISGRTKEQNVYCLDENGKICWQIQDPGLFKTGKISSPRDFMGEIWFKSDGALWVHGTSGSDYQIDIETGKIVKEVFTK